MPASPSKNAGPRNFETATRHEPRERTAVARSFTICATLITVQGAVRCVRPLCTHFRMGRTRRQAARSPGLLRNRSLSNGCRCWSYWGFGFDSAPGRALSFARVAQTSNFSLSVSSHKFPRNEKSARLSLMGREESTTRYVES